MSQPTRLQIQKPSFDLKNFKQRVFTWLDYADVDEPDQQALIDDFLKDQNYRDHTRNPHQKELQRFNFIDKRFERFKTFVYANTAYVD